MPRLAVVGGSVVGSFAALVLARAGWHVTVVDPELDRLTDPGPRLAPRPGAPHAVHSHGFMARVWHELSTRVPDVAAALLGSGAQVVPFAELCPPPLLDGGRPGDEELGGLRVARVTLDRVISRAVAAEPGVTRLPVKATGLLLDATGPVPRVTGLATAAGPVEADLVLDAGGRRSPVAGWLSAHGVALPERRDPGEATYYTRHVRFDPDRQPPLAGFADFHQFPTFHQFLFLQERGSASISLAVHRLDPVLKRLRHAEAFDAVLAANDAFVEWYAVLEPVSPVFCLGALDNRLRGLVDGGRPVVRGLVHAGDSLTMTNPTRGRGISMGLGAVGTLHDLLAAGLRGDDLVLAFDAWQQRSLAPYYREAAAGDAHTFALLRAGLFGGAVPRNAPDLDLPEGHPVSHADLERTAGRDPDLFRVLMRAVMLMDDERRVASPEVAARVLEVLDGPEPEREPETAPTPAPHGVLHDRGRLEELLGRWA